MNQQDRIILELFDAQIQELLKTKLLETNRNIGLSVGWKQGEPLMIETTLFDEEQLRSFLLAFRPFYMQKEPIHLYKVANVVHRCSDSIAVKEQLAKCRRHFGDILDRPSGRLVYNNQLLTPRHLIYLWFNAHYFHKEQEKIAEFNKVATGTGPMFQFFFQDSLCQLTDCILWLGARVKELLANEAA